MKSLNLLLLFLLLTNSTDNPVIEMSSHYRAGIKEAEKPIITLKNFDSQKPIQINWDVLIDIDYKERYFKSIDMVASAPVFGPNQLELDGKQIIIKGYVIPYDEEENYLSLSANPYASCFFCGNASPASVMSMYLKNDKKIYRVDDFLTFKGTLYLNTDDPNEFIYYLKNVVEVK